MIKRRAVNSFVTEDSDRTPICHNCLENNVTVRLEPYFMSDGREDKAYRYCPHCRSIVDANRLRYSGEVEVLGEKHTPEFEAIVSKRRIAKNKDESIFDINDYPLAGAKDTDLEYWSNQGIVSYVQDNNVQEDY